MERSLKECDNRMEVLKNEQNMVVDCIRMTQKRVAYYQHKLEYYLKRKERIGHEIKEQEFNLGIWEKREELAKLRKENNEVYIQMPFKDHEVVENPDAPESLVKDFIPPK